MLQKFVLLLKNICKKGGLVTFNDLKAQASTYAWNKYPNSFIVSGSAHNSFPL